MTVKEVASLVGISIRTLHHYDEIGLLKPQNVTESGYRLYSERDLETLQQILFFRELGFPLKQIREIISSPDFDRKEALELQQKMLLEQRNRLNKMILTIEKTIKHEKGEIKMTNKEKFEGFDFSHNPYEEEARKRYGDKAVNESNEKISKLSKKDQKEFADKFIAIYTKLAEIRHIPADSKEAQEAIGEWYIFLNTFGNYPPEAFKAVGQMYIDDERFTKNIDKFGEGLSLFMRDAMAIYADNLKK